MASFVLDLGHGADLPTSRGGSVHHSLLEVQVSWRVVDGSPGSIMVAADREE